MKQIKFLYSLLAMLLMLTCSVALTGCSDDDDDDDGGSITRDKLVGNWVLPYDYDSAEIYSLQSNGTCYYYDDYVPGTDYADTLFSCRWSLDSSTNTIIIWDDYEEESYEVISVTSTTLKWRDLVFGGGTQTLTKISDSELPTDIDSYY